MIHSCQICAPRLFCSAYHLSCRKSNIIYQDLISIYYVI